MLVQWTTNTFPHLHHELQDTGLGLVGIRERETKTGQELDQLNRRQGLRLKDADFRISGEAPRVGCIDRGLPNCMKICGFIWNREA